VQRIAKKFQLIFSAAALFLFVGDATRAQDSTPPPPAPPLAPAKPSSNMRPQYQWKRFDYTCEGGAKLIVFLHSNTAKVRFKDSNYLMRQTPSADGGRYSDGKVVWWGKGNGGFLQEDSPDGDGTMIVKDCQLEKPLNGEAAGEVTGTVSYLQRNSLPPTAVIVVQLQDVSKADAPAHVVAEEKITLGEHQVPVKFSIKFDPSKIEQKNRYAIGALILDNGRLRFVNEKSYPVLTQGNPNHVDLILHQAAATILTQPQSPQ
jgi:putative lipoprotein